MTTTEREDPDLDQAHARMARLAVKLMARFGAMPAANVLASAALALLTANFGKETAARYLKDLASEVEADDPAPNQIN